MNKKILFGAAAGLALPRAVLCAPRADAANAAQILAELKTAFTELQSGLDEQIRAKADVLINEKVDRINDSVGSLQAALDEITVRMKAAELNGNAGGSRKRSVSAAQLEYSEAFAVYMAGGGDDAFKAAALKAAAIVGDDTKGGYLVPETVDPTIDRVASVQGGLVGLARTVSNVRGGSWKKLVNQGGATAGWVGETDSRSETASPNLAEIEIVLGEVYTNPFASQQALDDAAGLEEWLRDEVMVTLDEAENAAIVTGNGVKKPRGLMSYDIVANASYAWGKVGYIASGGASDFASSTPDNALQDMISALKTKYRGNATWIGNRATVGKVRKFKDTTGQPLWQPSLQLGQPATLLGYPVAEDDNFADVGANAYPLSFGDFRQAYAVCRKAGLGISLRDPYTNKPYVGFYTTRRVGGGVINFEAFKVLKIASS